MASIAPPDDERWATVITATVEQAMDEALEGKRLLTHPFYQRWEAGELSQAELTDYAQQYRHFEAALPSILRGILADFPEGDGRAYVEDNLADEAGNPSHLQLFETFLSAVDGEPSAPVSPAMGKLLETYTDVVAEGHVPGLGGLLAYECQAPEVAKTKGVGLRRHYQFTPDQTTFWDVHAELDVEHADWATEALTRITDDTATVESAARRVADAWWAFLDEREAA